MAGDVSALGQPSTSTVLEPVTSSSKPVNTTSSDRAFLTRCFAALDTSLNLYTMLHTNDPAIVALIPLVRNLMRAEFSHQHLAQILLVYPRCYTVQVDSRGVMTLGVEGELQTQMAGRLARFEELLSAHLAKHGAPTVVPDPERWIASLVPRGASEPLKRPLGGAESPAKKARYLANEPQRFVFKPLQAATTGLSLIERIRLKERLKAALESPGEAPARRRQRYLQSQTPAIYDILFTSAGKPLYSASHYLDPDNFEPKQPQTKSLPLARVMEIVKDSVPHPMPEEDIRDVLHLIASVVEGVEMVPVSVGGESTHAVRVGNLDRNADLQKLQDLRYEATSVDTTTVE